MRENQSIYDEEVIDHSQTLYRDQITCPSVTIRLTLSRHFFTLEE